MLPCQHGPPLGACRLHLSVPRSLLSHLDGQQQLQRLLLACHLFLAMLWPVHSHLDGQLQRLESLNPLHLLLACHLLLALLCPLHSHLDREEQLQRLGSLNLLCQLLAPHLLLAILQPLRSHLTRQQSLLRLVCHNLLHLLLACPTPLSPCKQALQVPQPVLGMGPALPIAGDPDCRAFSWTRSAIARCCWRATNHSASASLLWQLSLRFCSNAPAADSRVICTCSICCQVPAWCHRGSCHSSCNSSRIRRHVQWDRAHGLGW